MEKNHKIIFTKSKGFSLLEVIIALFVLSVGILGMLSLISNSISNSNGAKDMIVASQLAQEGVELVRNKRDSNALIDPTNVFSGLSSADNCRIDVTSTLSCAGSSYNLNYASDGVTYRFVHSTGSSTKFSRKIVITSPSTEERKVRSFAWWGPTIPSADGSNCYNVNKCIYVDTVLTNWEENDGS